jgi:hypothetical protein
VADAAAHPRRHLRDHLRTLDTEGLLHRAERPVNSQAEPVRPPARLEGSGLPVKQRRAVCFTHVTDAPGGTGDGTDLIGGFAGEGPPGLLRTKPPPARPRPRLYPHPK